jgi:uncharacterized damage-inducible protein DinB
MTAAQRIAQPTPEHGALATDLERAVTGQPWHGPSLATLLEGVSARDAAAHPIAGAHSIWELVLHLTAWTDEVARRLGGATPAEPEAGDWPAMPDAPDAAAWRRAQDELHAAHRRVLAALAACPAERLAKPLGTAESPALGTGMSYRATVRGLAQHHAYHGGQIALLKRAVKER